MGCFHSKHHEEPIFVPVEPMDPAKTEHIQDDVLDYANEDHHRHDKHLSHSVESPHELRESNIEYLDEALGRVQVRDHSSQHSDSGPLEYADDDHHDAPSEPLEYPDSRLHESSEHLDYPDDDRYEQDEHRDYHHEDEHHDYHHEDGEHHDRHEDRDREGPVEEIEEAVEHAAEPVEEVIDEVVKPAVEEAKEEIERRLHHLVFPECYSRKRPSFYAAYARAARRYGFEGGRYAGFCTRNNVIVKLKGRRDRDIDHEVPAESIQNGDLEYVVPVKIGTPGIIAYLDFDTGSSDLWIWSCELANISKYFKAHHIYNPRRSDTAQKEKGTWQISYGDGSTASGDVYNDVVKVAGVTIPHQSIECARKLSSAFLADGGNDGLLGLAWPKLNTVEPHRVRTPVENMIRQRVIDRPVFTVKLGGGRQSGFYSFGYIDYNVTSHRLHYTDVDNSQGFWQVDSQSYSINDKIYDRRRNTAVLDTGTTLLLVDDETVRHIYGKIDGSEYDDREGGWKYPSKARIPEIAFAVGHYHFVIHEENFGFCSAGGGYTLGGIQSRGDHHFDIFGDVFLKNVYVVFNQGEKTVGVAQRD